MPKKPKSAQSTVDPLAKADLVTQILQANLDQLINTLLVTRSRVAELEKELATRPPATVKVPSKVTAFRK